MGDTGFVGLWRIERKGFDGKRIRRVVQVQVGPGGDLDNKGIILRSYYLHRHHP